MDSQKDNFIDWLQFDRRLRITYERNANAQTIYTAKSPRESFLFGKRDNASPLAIRWIKYKPNGTPQTIKYFNTYADAMNNGAGK